MVGRVGKAQDAQSPPQGAKYREDSLVPTPLTREWLTSINACYIYRYFVFLCVSVNWNRVIYGRTAVIPLPTDSWKRTLF